MFGFRLESLSCAQLCNCSAFAVHRMARYNPEVSVPFFTFVFNKWFHVSFLFDVQREQPHIYTIPLAHAAKLRQSSLGRRKTRIHRR